jgi:hypothetical protein
MNLNRDLNGVNSMQGFVQTSVFLLTEPIMQIISRILSSVPSATFEKGLITEINARIIKAHSHSMSGG